ncbi:hypothetical protein DBV14_12940 [Variovorax sp. KBW07]|uniref:hypothetical protein n=1 Tax=Variovorax sp. KBW07 TaxID=2153358 RepID=UPI000F5615E2|nr:hypothetical protein [Variovorax sp. KBW07]RQO54548.1 hypothetical protein DBV14_12940 [Variovorax sp. KBW07]
MRREKAWLIGIFMAVANVAAQAGPFGLNAGDTVEAVGKFAQLEPTADRGVYSVARLPNGHDDIDDYRLVFSPVTGLCKVTAWTKPAQTNAYGDEIKSDFRSWQEALTSKYGAPKKYDFLRSGSIWKEANDWTMALTKKERILAAFWEFKSPVDQVEKMALEAVASNSRNYMLNIQYEFTNYEACKAATRAKKNANL